MMGPWLIYAALVNRATMALYYGSPSSESFARFVQDAGVTMLRLDPQGETLAQRLDTLGRAVELVQEVCG